MMRASLLAKFLFLAAALIALAALFIHDGAPSAAAQQKLGTPSEIRLFPSNGTVQLSWRLDDNANRTEIRYGRCGNNLAQTITSPHFSHTVTGLDNGRCYTFSLRALRPGSTSLSPSDWSAGENATPNVPPRLPNLTATPGDGAITLSWPTPQSGAHPLAGYQIRWRPAQYADPRYGNIYGLGLPDGLLPATATSYTFTGKHLRTSLEYTVTNGETYEFAVTAISRRPDAPPDSERPRDHLFTKDTSITATAGTGPAVSPAPTGLNVTPGPFKLDLSWTAPSGTGTVTGYDIHYTRASRSTVADDAEASGSNPSSAWVPATRRTATDTTASHTISGVYAGLNHQVRVRAVTADGPGPWAFGSGRPTFPPITDFKVRPNDKSLVLSWTPPDLPAGITLSRYSLAYKKSAGTNWQYLSGTAYDSSNQPVDSFTIAGLENGVSYDVNLRALTSVWGSSAILTGSGTPNVQPPKLTSLTLTAGSHTVALSPAFDAYTTSYTATVAHDVTSVSVKPTWDTPTGDSVISVSVFSVTADTAATIITASTSAASSGDSVTANLASSGGTRVVSSIGESGGLNQEYVVVVSKAPAPPAAPAGNIWTAILTVHDFSPRSALGFNTGCIDGSSAASNKCEPSPGALTDDDFRAFGTDYEVVRLVRTASRDELVLNLDNAPPDTFKNSLRLAVNSRTFDLADAAVNQSGEFGWESSAIANWAAGVKLRVSLVPVLAPPTGLNVNAGNTRLDLTWTAPAGATVSGYDVHYTSAAASAVADDAPASGSNAANAWVPVTRSGTDALQAVTGLTNTTAYRVRVRAKNAGGAISLWLHGTGTPETGTPPPPPTGLGVTGAASRLDLTWTAPSGTVTGYDVHYTSAGEAVADNDPVSGTNAGLRWVAVTRTATDTTASQAITGIASNRIWRVRVRAVNAAGAGGWVHGRAATGTPPGAPGQINAVPGDGTLRVTYFFSVTDIPSITEYHVEHKEATAADQTATSVGDPSTGWVHHRAGHAITTINLGGLDNGVTYDIRVRGVRNGNGPWGMTTGTPEPPPPEASVSLSAAPNPVRECSDVTVTATLSQALSSTATIPLTLTDGTSEPTDYGTLAGITITSGRTSGSAPLSTSRDADTGDETFTVSLGTLPSLVEAGSPDSVEVTIRDDNAATECLRALPQGAPQTSLALYVSEGDKRLRLSWSPAAGELTGYRVEFKEESAPNQPGSYVDGRMDPSTGWIPWNRAGLDPHQVIFGLVNGVEYDLRVRAYNENGDGFWSGATGTPAPKPSVYLSAPAGVPEGSSVTVTALLSEPLSGNVTIPLTITDNTAEPTDHGTLRSITIRAGRTWAEGSITTRRDADPHHDTFTVAVATDGRLTSRVYAGSDSRVRITIEDLDAPTVSMSFPYPPAPHQWSTGVVTVNDGDSVEMMATLSQALEQDVTIPLEYQRNSAEREDYEPLSGITVKAGETCGIGTLRTKDDADTDDETLVILLARLTPVVQKGQPSALHITMRDNNTAATHYKFPPDQRTGCPSPQQTQSAPPSVAPVTSVALALGRDRVNEDAGQVTITATLDNPAPAGGLELRLYADAGSTAEKGTDYTLPESITVPYGGLSASVRIGITDDALDEPDETLVIGVFAQTDHATLQDTATLTIADNDGPPQQQQQSPGDQGSLIAKIRQWRSEWDRALLALGETVADATLTPMTAAEARALAGQDWADRWRQTAAALSQPENRAPAVANAMGDVTIVTESGTRQISLSGVFSDPDNDSLTITAASSDETRATVSVAADGSSLTVSARARGTSVITVTAADGRGGTISGSFTVTVKAAPTVALAPAGVSGLEVGSTRDVSLSGVFSDADGDALTVTAASSSDAVATVTVAAGYSSLTVTGVAEGTATITVTAQDADGNRVSHDFDVAVTPAPQQQQVVDPNNNAPTVSSAIADATIVKETGTHRVALSGVFSDADNDSLTVTAVSSDEDVATVSVAAGQSGLTVTAKARGTTTITVTANDGNGGTVSDSFTVTVKAAPVVASALADLSLAEGATPEVSLSGVFSDADGDALTVTTDTSDENVVNAFAFQDTLYVTAFTAGTATVTVTAQDTDGNTVSDAFDVTVAAPQQQQQDPPPNRAPTVASAIADVTITNESGTRQVSLSGVFTDADSDALTITAASSNEAAATASVASDYSVLTVSAQAQGTATITVTADDSNGGTVSDSFTVMVKAAPVVASAISDVSGLEEGAAQDVSLSGVFSDADGDSLTITAASSSDAKATVTVAADGSTLTLTGVAEGTVTITVTARDTDGNRVSDTFDVSVVKPPEPDEPDPPTGAPTVAAPIDDISLEGPESREIDLDGVFSGESLTFSAVTSDYGVATMWVSGSTLTVLGTGTGTATITVTAEDPDGRRVSDEFEVTVSPSIQEQ